MSDLKFHERQRIRQHTFCVLKIILHLFANCNKGEEEIAKQNVKIILELFRDFCGI